VDELAAIGSTIRRAGTTTVESRSAGSGTSLADTSLGNEAAGSARLSQEVATSSLTEVIRVSITVISNVPAGTFEEGKSEFRDWLIVDHTGSHNFRTILASFEVRASSTR
jgi:hypothetical protein